MKSTLSARKETRHRRGDELRHNKSVSSIFPRNIMGYTHFPTWHQSTVSSHFALHLHCAHLLPMKNLNDICLVIWSSHKTRKNCMLRSFVTSTVHQTLLLPSRQRENNIKTDPKETGWEGSSTPSKHRSESYEHVCESSGSETFLINLLVSVLFVSQFDSTLPTTNYAATSVFTFYESHLNDKVYTYMHLKRTFSRPAPWLCFANKWR
jgi:hypothetical protein